MEPDESYLYIKIRCISFCSSSFLQYPLNADITNDFEKSNEFDENEKNSNVVKLNLEKLIGNIYIGNVINTGSNINDTIKGKDVIGIFTINSKIINDELIVPYHDIIEYPKGDINDYLLCVNFRCLYESHLFLSNINCSKRLKYIIIFADNIFQILSFLKMLLKKKCTIIIFLSQDFDLNKMKINFEKYHISSKSIRDRIFIFSVKINIIKYIEEITNNLGVKIIIIFPNINVDKNYLKKTVLSISAINANLICTFELNFLNPEECKIIFEKGIKINFFNIDNYIYYDYFKRTEAFSYVLLSVLNQDIILPAIPVKEIVFTKIEDIFLTTPKIDNYYIYINKNVDDRFRELNA